MPPARPVNLHPRRGRIARVPNLHRIGSEARGKPPMPDATLPAKVRRAALEALTRDRLGEITTRFDLAVQDRRAVAAHIDAIVRAVLATSFIRSLPL